MGPWPADSPGSPEGRAEDHHGGLFPEDGLQEGELVSHAPAVQRTRVLYRPGRPRLAQRRSVLLAARAHSGPVTVSLTLVLFFGRNFQIQIYTAMRLRVSAASQESRFAFSRRLPSGVDADAWGTAKSSLSCVQVGEGLSRPTYRLCFPDPRERPRSSHPQCESADALVPVFKMQNPTSASALGRTW